MWHREFTGPLAHALVDADKCPRDEIFSQMLIASLYQVTDLVLKTYEMKQEIK